MSDLSLMHHPPVVYFDAVLTNHAETGYGGENPLVEAVISSLFRFPLFGKEDSLTKKMHVGSACRREAVPHEEQLCVQERENHNKGALSAASNACKTDRHSRDITWDMGLPLVFDDATFPSENKHREPPTMDREIVFCPSGNWNDDYSISDDDEVSLYGEQISYCSSEDDNEGHFYFTPTPVDFPQAFVPSTTLVLTIFDVPKHAVPELKQELVYDKPEHAKSELKRELVYNKPKYAKQECKQELEYEDPGHAESELKQELDLWGMIWQGLEKALSFGQKPDNHSQTEERHRQYTEREDSANMSSRFEGARTTPLPRGTSSSMSSTSHRKSSSSSTSTTSRHGRSSSSMSFRSLPNEFKNVPNTQFTRSSSANMSSMTWRDGPKTVYTAPLTRSGTRDNLAEFFTASEADELRHDKGWDSKDLLQKIGPTTLDPHTSEKARQVVPGLVKKEMKQAPTIVDGSELSRRTSRRRFT